MPPATEAPTTTPQPVNTPTATAPAFGNQFDGERAYADIAYQVSLGPRPVGSEAHAQTINWILDSLEVAGWEAAIQEFDMAGHPVKNIVASRGEQTQGEWIILGAHYDTRLFADQDADPDNLDEPVMGANDGASGVAVLLELARVLPVDLDKRVWLVFFDAEDNGRIEDWDWILGSTAFVAALEEHPDMAVVVDMIGDADLQVYYEVFSDQAMREEIWSTAAELGYQDTFIPEEKYTILDDHKPFLDAGIPAVDIIDFDYPYWHTIEDTLDKTSPQSLKIIGDTLLTWLTTH
jgi:Zn-dependent M28 family amino/carboxypeptidase